MIRGIEIFSAIIQAVIIVIPVWVSIAVFLVNKSPFPGDKFAIFAGSILTVITWQIIRMMNIITEQVSELSTGILAEEVAPRGSPLYSSTEIILRIDELLIAFWFLAMTLLYLSVFDRIANHVRRISQDEERKIMSLAGRRVSIAVRNKIASTIGYFLWLGSVLLVSFIVAYLGGTVLS